MESNFVSDPLYIAGVWLGELYVMVTQKKIRTETSPEVLRLAQEQKKDPWLIIHRKGGHNLSIFC